jgi:hypothetical protein
MSSIPPHIKAILDRRSGKAPAETTPVAAGPPPTGKKAEKAKPAFHYKDIIRDAPSRKVVREYFAAKVAKLNEPPESDDEAEDGKKKPKKTTKAK